MNGNWPNSGIVVRAMITAPAARKRRTNSRLDRLFFEHDGDSGQRPGQRRTLLVEVRSGGTRLVRLSLRDRIQPRQARV